jgi:hypothetical protein
MAWTEVLPSGKYRALHRDPTGKRRSAGTFDHKRRAMNAASAAEQESRSRGWQDPDSIDRPWGEWATEWWETRKVEPTTMASETYLLESLSDTQMGDRAPGGDHPAPGPGLDYRAVQDRTPDLRRRRSQAEESHGGRSRREDPAPLPGSVVSAADSQAAR